PELNDLMQLALEMDRDLFDSWGLDFRAGDRSEAGFGKFRVLLGDGVRGINHLPPHWLRHHVDAKLIGLPDVFQGVLLAAVGITCDRQRDHWRDDTHNREETERRQIGNPRGTHCRSPADRTWYDGACKQTIDSARINGGRIEFQVVSHEWAPW